mgnify:CR=1 FL=1
MKEIATKDIKKRIKTTGTQESLGVNILTRVPHDPGSSIFIFLVWYRPVSRLIVSPSP